MTDVFTHEELAIKLEPENAKIPQVATCLQYLQYLHISTYNIYNTRMSQLFLEFEFYKRLGPDPALPKVHFYGRCGKFNAMVEEEQKQM